MIDYQLIKYKYNNSACQYFAQSVSAIFDNVSYTSLYKNLYKYNEASSTKLQKNHRNQYRSECNIVRQKSLK